MFKRPNTASFNNEHDETMMWVNTMEFPEAESDRFFVGANDYNIYQANMHM